MAVTFLLDENIEHEVLHRLEKYGYDTVHVEREPDLGKGTTDTTLAEFSNAHDRVIVTYDDDFIVDHDHSEYFGVVFFGEDSLSARQVADILHTMADLYPESAFEGVEYASREWL